MPVGPFTKKPVPGPTMEPNPEKVGPRRLLEPRTASIKPHVDAIDDYASDDDEASSQLRGGKNATGKRVGSLDDSAVAPRASTPKVESSQSTERAKFLGCESSEVPKRSGKPTRRERSDKSVKRQWQRSSTLPVTRELGKASDRTLTKHDSTAPQPAKTLKPDFLMDHREVKELEKEKPLESVKEHPALPESGATKEAANELSLRKPAVAPSSQNALSRNERACQATYSQLFAALCGVSTPPTRHLVLSPFAPTSVAASPISLFSQTNNVLVPVPRLTLESMDSELSNSTCATKWKWLSGNNGQTTIVFKLYAANERVKSPEFRHEIRRKLSKLLTVSETRIEVTIMVVRDHGAEVFGADSDAGLRFSRPPVSDDFGTIYCKVKVTAANELEPKSHDLIENLRRELDLSEAVSFTGQHEEVPSSSVVGRRAPVLEQLSVAPTTIGSHAECCISAYYEKALRGAELLVNWLIYI